jgi:tripartite-type tricarboxylate transporter receptor subunit TctC
MIMSIRSFLITTGAVAAAAFIAAHAHAQQQEATYFKGKEISISIGFGPGGGYDTYGRLFARHYGRFVPGKPTVIAKNEPGAGGIKLATTIFNVAPKDGSQLALFAASTALEPLFGNKDAKYETTKFTWIGNIDSDVSSCGTWKNTGIKTWEDLKNRVTTFGSTGPAAITSIHPQVVGSLLGLKVKVIHGYSGTRDVNLAMRKGEVDGTCGLYMSSIASQYQQDVDNGDLTIWITLGKKRTPEFPKVPSIFELLKNPDDIKLADLIFGSDAIGRPVSAPPGMTAARTKTLRDAFNTMVKDAAFLADAKKIGLDIKPMTGQEVESLFANFYKTPQPVVQRAMKAMGR